MEEYMAGQSIAELERDAEIARADFARSVDNLRAEINDTSEAIRARVAPQAIASQVTTYAQENPLRAIAIGTLCAYPVLQLLRNIPLPVALIGAGLVLSTRGNGTAVDGESRFPGQDAANSVKQKAAESLKSAQTSALDLAGKTTDLLADKASAIAEGARATSANLSERAKAKMSDASDYVTQTARSSAAAASDRLAGAADSTRTMTQQSYDKVPLVFGGLALLAGLVVASALPTTEVERNVAGETSDELKQRAAARAEQTFQSAKRVMSDVAADAAQRAAELGVSREGIGGSVDQIGEKVKAVADKAVTTAFEMPPEDVPGNSRT
jgi:ElaB/YqjD/DUF883 family membrane-anchored ribosome-binding protein